MVQRTHGEPCDNFTDGAFIIVGWNATKIIGFIRIHSIIDSQHLVVTSAAQDDRMTVLRIANYIHYNAKTNRQFRDLRHDSSKNTLSAE